MINARGILRKVVGNDTISTDTSFTVVLYAQRGLDTLQAITFARAAGEYATPVVYRTISRGRGIDVIDSSNSGRTFLGQLQRSTVQVNVPATDQALRTPTSALDVQSRSDSPAVLRVTPNPVIGDVLDIHALGLIAPLHIQLLSMRGEVIRSEYLPSWIVHRAQLTVGELPNGMYGIRVIGSDGTVAVSRFIIVR